MGTTLTDDTVLIGENEEDLKELLDVEEAERKGLN